MADRRSKDDWEIAVLRCLADADAGLSVTDMAGTIKPENPAAARAAVHTALMRLETLDEVTAPRRPPKTSKNSKPKRTSRGWEITAKGRRRLERHERSERMGRIATDRSTVSLSWRPRRVRLPVMGRVAGGEPISVDAYAEDYADQTLDNALPLGTGEFLLEVEGDSMVHIGIESGDYLVVRPLRAEDTKPYDVVVAAVRLAGSEDIGLTVKRWVPDGDGIRLGSAPNPAAGPAASPSQYYERSEVEVVGRPVAIVRRLDAWKRWPTPPNSPVVRLQA